MPTQHICKHCQAALPEQPDYTQSYQEGESQPDSTLHITRHGVREHRRCTACGRWDRVYVDYPLPRVLGTTDESEG